MIARGKKLLLQAIVAALVFAVVIGIEQIFYLKGIPTSFNTAPY
jgi:hypothetical protein